MSENSGQLVEHFFRHESANLIAVLCRAFGLSRIELVEDMVQHAMLEAMNAWKHDGIPTNPAGWIHRVAKNRVIDEIRRETVHARAMAFAGTSIESTQTLVDQWLETDQIPDSLLRMMFVCCHPSLDRASQIALTLKTLCGFSVGEIARGLLMQPGTVKKRIQRAKKKLADQTVTLELPEEDELANRMSSVHEVLYLMFNEGYSTTAGTSPIRDEVCEEAARLCHILCEHELGSQTTYALLAIMLCHGARLDSRVDSEGKTILLEDQDRSTWDKKLIGVAQTWLSRSGPPKSRFHLEAGIAMFHCCSESVDATDWEAIVGLYDRLVAGNDSPVYILNRAIAIAQCGRVEAALEELERIKDHPEMRDYFLLQCSIAKVHEINGDRELAIDACLAALSKTTAEHDKNLLKKKISQLNSLG